MLLVQDQVRSLAQRLRYDLEPRVRERSLGQRLDQALAGLFPEFSRSRLQAWIRAGRVSLDGNPCRPRDRLRGGERIELRALFEPQVECAPQAIALR